MKMPKICLNSLEIDIRQNFKQMPEFMVELLRSYSLMRFTTKTNKRQLKNNQENNLS